VGRKVKVGIEDDCPECEGRGTVRSVYVVDEADLEVEEDQE
jgi:hypothetical protein